MFACEGSCDSILVVSEYGMDTPPPTCWRRPPKDSIGPSYLSWYSVAIWDPKYKWCRSDLKKDQSSSHARETVDVERQPLMEETLRECCRITGLYDPRALASRASGNSKSRLNMASSVQHHQLPAPWESIPLVPHNGQLVPIQAPVLKHQKNPGGD